MAPEQQAAAAVAELDGSVMRCVRDKVGMALSSEGRHVTSNVKDTGAKGAQGQAECDGTLLVGGL